ncbi:MAG: pentapeptide repeat-containing protein [Rhizomicrobium sp.]
MTPIQLTALAAAFIIGIALTALIFWLRERGDDQKKVTEYRDVYEPLFADLWSNEMHKRLAALFVAQRVARSRGAAKGLANVLISFIRRRFANEPGEGDSFEDVRLALNILTTNAVRSAQSSAGQNIDLGGIDFRGAAFFGVDLHGFRLAQCNFDRCQLASANLADADLSGASMVGTNLQGADLRRADLSDTDVSEADFSRAKLNAAKFSNVNISGTILADAQGFIQDQLDLAFGDSETALPERMRFVAGRTRPRRSDT